MNASIDTAFDRLVDLTKLRWRIRLRLLDRRTRRHSPSGPGFSAQLSGSAIPDGYRPRDAADPTRTPHPKLHRDHCGDASSSLLPALSRDALVAMRRSARRLRGRDARFWAPPAQIRASGIPALGSYLGCLTAKRTLGHGWRTRGLGRNSSASFAIRVQTSRALWLRRRSCRCQRMRTW
jgi:hypothetical protein